MSESLISIPHLQSETDKMDMSRHDNSNLELKTFLSLTEDVRVGRIEVSLFAPSAANVRRTLKTEMISDFRVRARLFLPVGSVFDDRELNWKLNQLDLQSQLIEQKKPEALDKETEDLLLSIGAHMSEKYNQFMILGKTKQAESEAEQKFLRDLNIITSYLDRVRTYLERMRSFGFEGVQLLDEVLSVQHTEYLIRLEKFAADCKGQAFAEKLAAQLKAQADRNYSVHGFTEDTFNLHSNYLKKYFQSHMAADLSQQDAIKRVSEPIAAMAAGFAAILVSLLERSTKGDSVTWGIRSILILLAGGIAYALKDRFKDWGRQYLTKKIQKIIPDHERDIFVQKNKIGHSKEWFLIRAQKDMPAALIKARKSLARTAAERKLVEDILQYRQDFELSRKYLGDRSGNWGLMQNIRINLDRYLKHLDDPMKTYKLIDRAGKVAEVHSHRYYQFYICLTIHTFEQQKWWVRRVTSGTQLKTQERKQQWFEIIVDKSGIKELRTLTLPG